MAKRKECNEASDLYKEADLKFAAAFKVKPDFVEALISSGIALSERARLVNIEEAENLYKRAYELFSEADQMKPDDHSLYYNWGSALLIHSSLVGDTKANELLLEAERRLSRSVEIFPRLAEYNLACAEARLGKESECRELLNKCPTLGILPSREHLLTDEDLVSVRDKE